MQVQVQQHYYTPEDYLAIEEDAEYRSEYHDGEILAMVGGTFNHNRIAGNLFAALNFSLKDQKAYDVAMGECGYPTHRVFFTLM
jgi:Uma2 family endonuclease